MAMQIEIIATFDNHPQHVGSLEFPSRPSEAEFLHRALASLTDDQRVGLRKISACQIVGDTPEPLTWLAECGGKFYFAVDAGEPWK